MNSRTNTKKIKKVGPINAIKNYFQFDDYKTIFKKEIIGGITTFLAMCYILAVNPSIVGQSPITPDGQEFASQYAGGLFLTTAISAFIATMLMGLWAKVPVALAPGMGLNAFFAFTVARSLGFESALTVTILSGILYLIVVLTPLRKKISESIPTNFKIAVGAGIGLFVAFVGLQNAGIVVGNSNVPITGIGDFTNPLIILALCLILLGLVLHFAKVPGAMIITMLFGAIILIILCVTGVVNKGQPNYGLLGSYADFSQIKYVLKAGWVGFTNIEMWKNPMTYVGILSFLYMDFFDTTGSLIVVDKLGGFEKFNKHWMIKANHVDAVSTIIGAGIGATTVTTFVESTSGIGAGARTGFAAIITAIMFALSIALWPIIQVFMPIEGLQPITSVALVVIGAVMLSQIRNFEWEIFADIPTLFVTIIMMLLTNSIAHGLSFGMITYVVMNFSLGLIQKIKHKKKVVNDISMPITDKQHNIKTREYNYWNRLNGVCIGIAIISMIYIVIETGTTYANWF